MIVTDDDIRMLHEHQSAVRRFDAAVHEHEQAKAELERTLGQFRAAARKIAEVLR